MKIDIKRLAPPGIDLGRECALFGAAVAVAVIMSFSFISRYNYERAALFYPQGTLGAKPVLIPGAVMPDFATLIPGIFNGFVITLVFLLCIIVRHYLFYSNGSHSLYLMKRLPDKGLLPRQCLTLPAAGIVICFIVVIALFLLYYFIYMKFTPTVCLSPDQWQKIWGF